jgi:hypothetical protein
MQLRAIPTEETLLLYDEPEYKLLDSAAVTPSLTPMEVLFKADFWMLWMTFLCTAGVVTLSSYILKMSVARIDGNE